MMKMYPHQALDRIAINTEMVFNSINELPSHTLRRGFEAAARASKESEWYQTRDMMGAAILAGSRIIAMGSNAIMKSKPSNRFTKVMANGKVVEYTKSIHAEQSALIKIRHMDYSRLKLSMFVYREDAKGRLVSSFPCELCQSEIRKSGLSVVYFITPDRHLGIWRI